MNIKLKILLFVLASVAQNIFGQLKDIKTPVHDKLTGTINGFVMDENNSPVPNAVVLLFKRDSLEDKKVTDVNGRYTFTDVAPGSYNIKVNHSRYINYEFSSFEIIANNTSHLEVKLQAKAFELRGSEARIINFKHYYTSCGFTHRTRCFYIPSVKIYIVDDSGKSIIDPVVWRFNQPYDSVKRGRSVYNDSVMDYYTVPINNTYNNYPDKWLLIQAKGYADVIIRNFELSDPRFNKPPVLYIRMYPRQYLRKGDTYTLINTFVYDNVTLTDSVQLDLKYYTEYVFNLTEGNDKRFFMVKTYPNPVREKLFIDINVATDKPCKALLFDLQGQMLSETLLYGHHSELDMQWQSAGAYFIQVFDPGGTLLYAFKFLKI